MCLSILEVPKYSIKVRIEGRGIDTKLKLNSNPDSKQKESTAQNITYVTIYMKIKMTYNVAIWLVSIKYKGEYKIDRINRKQINCSRVFLEWFIVNEFWRAFNLNMHCAYLAILIILASS